MELVPGTLEAFGLYLVRTSALVLPSPVLGLAAGFQGFKIALIFATAFLAFAATGEPLPPETSPIALGVLALREILIGFFLAFLLQLAVLTVRVAGAMIGHEMGFAMAQQVDPESGIQVPLVTRIYENLFLLGIFLVDGHHWLLRALAQSFERAPVGVMSLEPGMLHGVKTMFAEMFAAGISFAAPVMVLLVLVSILIGLLSRAVPQLNVLEVGFSVRIGLSLFAMMLFAPLVTPALEGIYGTLADALELAFGPAEGGR